MKEVIKEEIDDTELDCGFSKGKKRFRYRAGAIIIENGCVLFVGNAKEDYLYSIGGGVHLGETAEEAVVREIFEETGVHYEVDHLAVIHENFFDGTSGTLAGLQYHEISFYFVMKPIGSQKTNGHSYTYGEKEEMHWIPMEDIDKYVAFPSFMKDFVTHEHTGIEHIITRDRKTTWDFK